LPKPNAMTKIAAAQTFGATAVAASPSDINPIEPP
jgi:hypothetical protein